MQNAKIKMQNDREKFKESFIKRLVKFSVKILRLCEKLRKKRIMWPVTDQLIRSATSIGANVVEAKSSSSKKDYLRFFEIALKSANETKYWLILVEQCVPESKEETQKLLKEAGEISNVIGSSVLTLKGKK